MSRRIVLLGPRPTMNGEVQDECPTLQVSPNDAAALVAGGKVFPSMTTWCGPLEDATVLLPADSYNAQTDRSMYMEWDDLVGFLAQVGHPRYEVEMIPTPIPTS